MDDQRGKGTIPSWSEYGWHAMAEMKRFADIMEKMSEQVDEIERRQNDIETRTKVMGSVAGFCVAALVEVGRVIASFWMKHN